MEGGSATITLTAAFIAGFLSFLSPCVLPLLPSYVTYITGITFGELTRESLPKRVRLLTLAHSLMFIAGFTVVFVALGLSLNFLGGFLPQNRDIMRRAGGAIVVFFGLCIAGVINLGFLQKEKKLEFRAKPAGYAGSALVGAAFAIGWTPCVGPILASILVLSSATGGAGRGAAMLLSYSLGLAIPFLVSSLLINNFLAYFKAVKKHMRAISLVSGIFLIVIGAMIFTNSFGLLTGFFEGVFSP
ncbi:MAG: cytochrome c biogenesis protein CcdA [Candidatus Omnitrophota bacterium]